MMKDGDEIGRRIVAIEKRVEMLEDNQEEYVRTMHSVDTKVKSIDGRIEEEFKILVKSNENMREMIQQQSVQNNEILHKVLDVNDKAVERSTESDLKKYENMVQLITSLLTSGGVLYLLVQHFIGG